jgi:hypothetical protein
MSESVDRASILVKIQQQIVEHSKHNHIIFPAAQTQAAHSKNEGVQTPPSATLWKERQLRDFRTTNNLYYFCGDKFDTANLQKCTKRNKPQLNAIVLNDLDAELSEETLNQLEVEDTLDAEIGQLSLNAMAGTDIGDSMRIRALVHNKTMLILVDSGISHSFMSQGFLQQTGLQSQVVVPMSVKVANGQTLLSSQCVPASEWWSQGYTFHTGMRVLNIGAHDAILGYDWLKLHSPMVYHWS